MATGGIDDRKSSMAEPHLLIAPGPAIVGTSVADHIKGGFAVTLEQVIVEDAEDPAHPP